MNIKKRGVIITILGDSGVGKTTLACTSEHKTLLIAIEDGALPVYNFKNVVVSNNINSFAELIKLVVNLQIQEHNFKNIVFDSVTQLNTMLEDEIIAKDSRRPLSINTALGGYGAGFSAVAREHKRLRDGVSVLANKGINIFFIGHPELEIIDPPDEESYTQKNIKMNKKSASHYIDNVDAVVYLKLNIFVDGIKKRGITDGGRILICCPCPAYPTKNRFDIFKNLEVKKGINPLAQYITL